MPVFKKAVMNVGYQENQPANSYSLFDNKHYFKAQYLSIYLYRGLDICQDDTRQTCHLTLFI